MTGVSSILFQRRNASENKTLHAQRPEYDIFSDSFLFATAWYDSKKFFLVNYKICAALGGSRYRRVAATVIKS